MKSSIGIIGGADGPTSIFVASPADGSLFVIGCAIVLAVAGIRLYWKKKKNNPDMSVWKGGNGQSQAVEYSLAFICQIYWDLHDCYIRRFPPG